MGFEYSSVVLELDFDWLSTTIEYSPNKTEFSMSTTHVSSEYSGSFLQDLLMHPYFFYFILIVNELYFVNLSTIVY